MKKFLLSFGLIVLFGGYVIYNRSQQVPDTLITAPAPAPANTIPPTQIIMPPSTPQPTSAPTTSQTTSSEPPTPKPSPTKPSTTVTSTPPPTPPAPKGQYRDGSYTGSVADAFYGNVQVEAVISGGKLADVQFLQYPNDRRTSVMISNMAMPSLKSEAIQAQSAQVDAVSGASDTSAAFVQSLSSALAQAKN